jgi:hypothetical protein
MSDRMMLEIVDPNDHHQMNGKSIKQARGKIGITTESALASTLSPMFCGPLARFVQVEEDLAALYLWRQSW